MSQDLEEIIKKKGRGKTSKGDIPLSYTKDIEMYFNTLPYAREWLNSIVRKRDSSIRSQQNYIAVLAHVSKVTGVKDFRNLTYEDISKYDELMFEWGMAPRTRKHALSVVNSHLQYSKIFNPDLINKINKDLKPREPKNEHRRYLSDIPGVTEVWNNYINSQKNRYNKFVLRLLSDYGLREEELVTCNLEDFDEGNLCLHIIGKGKKYRKVEFVEGFEERIIKTYYQYMRNRKIPRNLDDNNALLVTKFNTRPTPRAIYDFVNYHTKNALSEGFSPHKLRHFTASWLAILRDDNGDILYEPTKIMKFMGHESLDTTIRYIHTFAKGKEKLKKKLLKKYNTNLDNIGNIIKNCPSAELPKLIIRLHLEGKINDVQLDKYMTILGVKGRA